MPHMVNVCTQSSRPLRKAESNKADQGGYLEQLPPSQGLVQQLNVLKVSKAASADLLTSRSLGSIMEGRG